MKFSLVMVGAHDGSKTEDLVNASAKHGPVLLVEAVPWIFKKLVQRHIMRPQVQALNEAISLVDGEVDFYMIPEGASAINGAADQMSSLISTHATDHEPKLQSVLKKVQCKSRTFTTLVKDYGMTELDILVTDMEGADVETLIQFPFSLIRPYQILFEAKHADGSMHLGTKMATLLLLFESLDYRVCMLGSENFLAVDRKADPSIPRLKIAI